MKEAEGCHNLRGAVNQAVIRRCPNGETRFGKPKSFLSEYIGQESERRELKHLSSARKIKQRDSLSSGERKGRSLNLCHVITCECCVGGVVGCICSRITVLELWVLYFSRIVLERTTKESDSLVHERLENTIICTPEYHGAREIPWESARTIG